MKLKLKFKLKLKLKLTLWGGGGGGCALGAPTSERSSGAEDNDEKAERQMSDKVDQTPIPGSLAYDEASPQEHEARLVAWVSI